jgi:hypothetical protein
MLFGILHFLPDSDDPQAIVARFLDGLELVDPGITPMFEWRPELAPGPQPARPRQAPTPPSRGSRSFSAGSAAASR